MKKHTLCEKENHMEAHYINEERITHFERLLIEDEKCQITRKKYVRDVREFFAYTGESGLVTKEAFRSAERELTKEEYYRLLETARAGGNKRLYLLMETICATGIRVSELPFITVESLCTRRARVSLKGKTRTVILSQKLCRELKQYVREKEIRTGSIFVTRNGQPLNRSNIFKKMKSLCEKAGVD